MDIQLAAIGTFVVVVVVVLGTSALNLKSVRRGLGPDRSALRIQTAALGAATFLFALLGMAWIYSLGFGLIALLAVPLLGVGLLLVQKSLRGV